MTEAAAKLSRAEIERLCLLRVLDDPCTVVDVAERLGLSAGLANAVMVALRSLESQSLVVVVDGIVERTPIGTDRLKVALHRE